MTAYELSEFKIQLLTQKQYLAGELGTDSETVLLTDKEVQDVITALDTCMCILDENLRMKG